MPDVILGIRVLGATKSERQSGTQSVLSAADGQCSMRLFPRRVGKVECHRERGGGDNPMTPRAFNAAANH